MLLSNSALFYRFQNLYLDLDLHAHARLHGNAAQSIRPNEIIWGCMPRTPPPPPKKKKKKNFALMALVLNALRSVVNASVRF